MNGYRLKLLVALEKEGVIVHLHEFMLPDIYLTLEEAQSDIKADIRRRLQRSNYFRSQRYGFDMVRYSSLAQRNTLLAWRVVPLRRHPVVSG